MCPVIYTDPEGEFNFETNQVEKGDTLRGVFGNNWQEVSNYNNLSNPGLIYPDQHLNLPVFFQKDSWQKVIDAIYTFIPGFSDVRDVYEAITKTDFIEGRALTPGEESLTVPAALIVGVLSGKEIRGISKFDSWLKSKLGDASDWIRFGRTHIPKEISKTETDVFTWGVKGTVVSR